MSHCQCWSESCRVCLSWFYEMTYQVKYAKINLTGFLRFKNSFLWNVWMDGGWSRQPLVHSLDTLFDRSDNQDKFCYQKISGLNVQRSIIARNYILFTTQIFRQAVSHTQSSNRNFSPRGGCQILSIPRRLTWVTTCTRQRHLRSWKVNACHASKKCRQFLGCPTNSKQFDFVGKPNFGPR